MKMGGGVKPMKGRGRKKALSWRLVFKNHKSIKKAAIVADCGFLAIVYK